jgi:2-iminobutanoate/2-iminopropanoate deaminase
MKSLKLTLLFLTASLLFSCQPSEKSESKPTPKPNFIQSQYEARHSAPFSDATEYQGLLFLTGQIGKDHKAGKMVEGGIQAETRQVLTNIKDVLEANGSDMNHVLKCTVILSDINDFPAMNEVYRTFFVENKPARTTFAANLVAGAKIEIEVVAAKK